MPLGSSPLGSAPLAGETGTPPAQPDPVAIPSLVAIGLDWRRSGRTVRNGPPTLPPIKTTRQVVKTVGPDLRRRGRTVRHAPHLIDWAKRYHTARGLYRVFNAATYRFYRSNSAPPSESDSPFATNATLPHEPTDTYADGTWYLSVSYFNGVLDSGFLPLGTKGETYLRLDLASGASVASPPDAPVDVRLEAESGGVVRVLAVYAQTGSLRATDWAIAYTVDGTTPAEGSPDVTETLGGGVAVLSYALPSQSHGTTVKVLVQTKRGTSYSEGSEVLTATADAQGPAAPDVAWGWTGYLPEEA